MINRIALLGVLSVLAQLCWADPSTAQSAPADTVPADPLKQAYFGDLHLHTAYSLDSYVFGNRNDPDTAYRFAEGERVSLYGGQTKQLKHPLDFLAVTDHAEYMGELALCTTEGAPEYKSAMCQGVRKGDMAQVFRISASVSSPERKHIVELCGEDGARCRDGSGAIWQRIQAAAAGHYKPGKFTTLIGFEYSPGVPPSGPKSSSQVPGMMHRNVMFSTGHVPDRRISYMGGPREFGCCAQEVLKNERTDFSHPTDRRC